MTTLNRKRIGVFALLLALFLKPVCAHQQQEKNGELVMKITDGDIDNSPADHVYVEAYGFGGSKQSRRSFVLQSPRKGEYKISLPPGIYDVFVSDEISDPRCKRVQISPGLPTFWTLKLEMDFVYTKF
ncbi:MAG TPA: hypothetical protein VGJ30_11870 [Candidatus Angelobacter sp.]|jgi:hypothetical protein